MVRYSVFRTGSLIQARVASTTRKLPRNPKVRCPCSCPGTNSTEHQGYSTLRPGFKGGGRMGNTEAETVGNFPIPVPWSSLVLLKGCSQYWDMSKTPAQCFCSKLWQLGHTTAPEGSWVQCGLAMAKCGHLPLQRGTCGTAPEKPGQEQPVSQSHLRSDLQPKQTSHILGKSPAASSRCLTAWGYRDAYAGVWPTAASLTVATRMWHWGVPLCPSCSTARPWGQVNPVLCTGLFHSLSNLKCINGNCVGVFVLSLFLPLHTWISPLLLVSMARIWAVIIKMLWMNSLLYSVWVLRSPSSTSNNYNYEHNKINL